MNIASGSESTARGRELGDAIRLALERADLTGKRLSELLDWSESKVSRIVTGHVVPSEIELSALLALCGVVGAERAGLLGLCRDQSLSNWSTDRTAVARQQQSASKITEFHNSLVPHLLQTENYARSTISRMVNIEDDGFDSWLSERMGAQSVIDRMKPKTLTCTFFIHQLVLELPVGGREVMSEQLHRILQLSVRRNITIRIVPTSLGAYPGSCGPFRLIEFSEFRPVAYVEDEIEGHFLEEYEKINSYRKLIAALSVISLDASESTKLIGARMERYGKGLNVNTGQNQK